MEKSSFDPTRAVAFDLARGHVTLQGGAAIVLSAEVLARLCTELDEGARRRFGASLGALAGERVRARMGSQATIDVVVDQLGGELCLAGLGSLGIERWGQALVVRFEGCPLGNAGHELMAAYVEAALAALAGREVKTALLEQDQASFRLLLCNSTAAAKVSGWVAAGRSFGEALAALHQNPRNDVMGGAR